MSPLIPGALRAQQTPPAVQGAARPDTRSGDDFARALRQETGDRSASGARPADRPASSARPADRPTGRDDGRDGLRSTRLEARRLDQSRGAASSAAGRTGAPEDGATTQSPSVSTPPALEATTPTVDVPVVVLGGLPPVLVGAGDHLTDQLGQVPASNVTEVTSAVDLLGAHTDAAPGAAERGAVTGVGTVLGAQPTGAGPLAASLTVAAPAGAPTVTSAAAPALALTDPASVATSGPGAVHDPAAPILAVATAGSGVTPGQPGAPGAGSATGSPATLSGMVPVAVQVAATAGEAAQGGDGGSAGTGSAPLTENPVPAAGPAPTAQAGTFAQTLSGLTGVDRVSAPAATGSAAQASLADQVRGPVLALRTAAPGEHVLTLKVTPENLGPVQVRAHIGAEGVRIELVGATDAAREGLRNLLTDLRRDLAGTGMNATLSLGSDSGPGARSGQGGAGDLGAPGDGSGQARSGRPTGSAAARDVPAAPPVPTTPTSSGAHGVDILT